MPCPLLHLSLISVTFPVTIFSYMSNQYPNQSGFPSQQNAYQNQNVYGNAAGLNNSELVFAAFRNYSRMTNQSFSD